MKTISFLKAAFLIAAIPFLFGCEKESLSELQVSSESALGKKGKQVERPFNGRAVSGMNFKAGPGWDGQSTLPAWYYGTGEGNATHLGKFTLYVNQYTIPYSATSEVAGTVLNTGKPVNMFFADTLYNTYGITVPDEVSFLLVDKQGKNSIWGNLNAAYWEFQYIDGIIHLTIESKVEIIGGTGRFTGATGEFTISGNSLLNPITRTTNETLDYDGVIIY